MTSSTNEICDLAGKRLIKREAKPNGQTSLKWLQKAGFNDPLRSNLKNSGCSLLLQCGAGFFDQTAKGDFVPDRQIGEDLAVKGYFSSGQALHKSAVSNAIPTAGGIDPNNP